jgi:hypothetical protein
MAAPTARWCFLRSRVHKPLTQMLTHQYAQYAPVSEWSHSPLGRLLLTFVFLVYVVWPVSKETYYSVKRDLLSVSVKRDL